jgi:predicted TIM-barrel fold metal-dependent hydrolase
MGFIDAHVHVWTPDVQHYPLAAGYKPADMKPPSFTPEELFRHGKPAGVERINLIQMSFYGFEIVYEVQSADGSLGAGTTVKYDLKQMKAG